MSKNSEKINQKYILDNIQLYKPVQSTSENRTFRFQSTLKSEQNGVRTSPNVRNPNVWNPNANFVRISGFIA